MGQQNNTSTWTTNMIYSRAMVVVKLSITGIQLACTRDDQLEDQLIAAELFTVYKFILEKSVKLY